MSASQVRQNPTIYHRDELVTRMDCRRQMELLGQEVVG
jgi:hypothetical protein